MERNIPLNIYEFLITFLTGVIGIGLFMYMANFFTFLASFAIDGIGLFMGLLAESNEFWNFIVTVLDSGWIMFLFILIPARYALSFCDDIITRILSAAAIAFFIICVYDGRVDIPFFGLIDWLRDSLNCTLWRTFDATHITFDISPMRYTVFDIAAVLALAIGVFIPDCDD